MNRKAIILLSGGLDSILATKLMMEQGIEVVSVHYFIEFAVCTKGGSSSAVRAAKALGVPLKVFDITDEYLEMFKKPMHGYGANINPCIDCKIFMLKKAKEYMKEVGASFLVTGEVLGERPMSQRRDALNIIERDAGVRGILLRPLTAKTLNPTLPEKEGIVDREKLEDIAGRSRKRQIELAAQFGIKEYPNPAGGCLLTDPGFTKRIKDLIRTEDLTLDNLRFIKTGRYYRFSDSAKLVVGRTEAENEVLLETGKNGDLFLRLKDRPSPIGILRGDKSSDIIQKAAAIVAYHTKYRNEDCLKVVFWENNTQAENIVEVKAVSQKQAEEVRI